MKNADRPAHGYGGNPLKTDLFTTKLISELWLEKERNIYSEKKEMSL